MPELLCTGAQRLIADAVEVELQALLGIKAKGLSASTISHCKKIWEKKHETWNSRSIENKRYACVWVDGVESYLGPAQKSKILYRSN